MPEGDLYQGDAPAVMREWPTTEPIVFTKRPDGSVLTHGWPEVSEWVEVESGELPDDLGAAAALEQAAELQAAHAGPQENV